MSATDWGLVLAAAGLGLAGAPHCAAMCSAPCSALLRGGGAVAGWQFHAGRLAGYSAAGALLAAGVGALQALATAAPLLRPAWTLLHVAALALGAWLLIQGRQPAWLGSLRAPRLPGGLAMAGLAWVGWPCALLQSALVVASLTATPVAGALAMAAFAVLSAPGLQLAPWVLQRLARWNGGNTSVVRAVAVPWAVRLAGLALLAGSAVAIGHDSLARFIAWCAR